MTKKEKKSRLEFLHDIFKADINKNIENKMYSSTSSYDDNKNQKIYYDSYFSDFYHDVLINMNVLTLKSKVPSFDDMFDFFVFLLPLRTGSLRHPQNSFPPYLRVCHPMWAAAHHTLSAAEAGPLFWGERERAAMELKEDSFHSA